MKILFVLPMPATSPVGGYKVVYEYANRLSLLGHHVEITHAFINNPDKGLIFNLLRFFKWKMKSSEWRPDRWFRISESVKLSLIWNNSVKYFPKCDVIIATSWETAESISKFNLSDKKKFYLIQHFESWSGNRERVLATWRLPLQKIVISKWLAQIAEAEGLKTHYVQNGLSMDEFYIEQPLDLRDRNIIGTLYHQYDWKGFSDVFDAVSNLRKTKPELKLLAFGTPERPSNLPDWVEYHQSPSGSELRALYNRMPIFVSASWEEGWGLTPCEALLCGCAIAVSDNGGHKEFAIQNETALIFPVRNIAAIEEAINQLIDNKSLRNGIASYGEVYIRKLTWDIATEKLLSIIQC